MYTNISNAFALYVSQHLFHKMIKSTQDKSNFKDEIPSFEGYRKINGKIHKSCISFALLKFYLVT